MRTYKYGVYRDGRKINNAPIFNSDNLIEAVDAAIFHHHLRKHRHWKVMKTGTPEVIYRTKDL